MPLFDLLAGGKYTLQRCYLRYGRPVALYRAMTHYDSAGVYRSGRTSPRASRIEARTITFARLWQRPRQFCCKEKTNSQTLVKKKPPETRMLQQKLVSFYFSRTAHTMTANDVLSAGVRVFLSQDAALIAAGFRCRQRSCCLLRRRRSRRCNVLGAGGCTIFGAAGGDTRGTPSAASLSLLY